MRTQRRQPWITGDEFGVERRRLLETGHKHDSPEMVALDERVRERDDYLWERYAQPHIGTHRGEWAAVSIDGDILFGPTASAVMAEATDRFGQGNFAYGRM